MKIFRIRTFDEYKRHADKNAANYNKIREYEAAVASTEREFTVKGVSYPANQPVEFLVDYQYSDQVNINWRERLICPITGLNNRLRSCVHLMDIELSPYPGDKIYITEQVTPLFVYLKEKFPELVGSEYLGNDIAPGTIIDNMRHEDMNKLSFEDEAFDHYLSFEVFEHIPEYKQSIKEIHRTLKPGGTFLGTFPFDRNSYQNLIRAKIDKQGNIVHLMEPEYHGDPVNQQGILCFTVFGWELLDEFRKEGFQDVYVVFLWSDVFGYLGGEQLFFIARKGKSKKRRKWFHFFEKNSKA